jgi:hypothetical protein
MHDFLEGTLVYSFGLLMNQLVQNSFTFEFFLDSLNAFNYQRIDKRNKIGKNPFSKFALQTKKGLKI